MATFSTDTRNPKLKYEKERNPPPHTHIHISIKFMKGDSGAKPVLHLL